MLVIKLVVFFCKCLVINHDIILSLCEALNKVAISLGYGIFTLVFWYWNLQALYQYGNKVFTLETWHSGDCKCAIAVNLCLMKWCLGQGVKGI